RHTRRPRRLYRELARTAAHHLYPTHRRPEGWVLPRTTPLRGEPFGRNEPYPNPQRWIGLPDHYTCRTTIRQYRDPGERRLHRLQHTRPLPLTTRQPLRTGMPELERPAPQR